jgi:hypothetical protein
MTSRGEAAGDGMKRLLIGFLLLLGAAGVVGAQEESGPAEGTKTAASFELTSAPKVSLLGASAESSEAPSVAAATAEGEAPATPPAKPRFVFGDRDDYRWQLGMGVEIFRFLSSRFDATMAGTNTMVTYFTNGWFAFEGNLVTGFAPEIYQSEHVKLFGGGGGIRVGSRRARWEPWGHVLVGGAHLQPQTANASKTALMVQTGGGVDYRVHARLSIRLEGDWVYTTFFSQTQNSFQGVAGVVLHF